jgi:hypothetical protein
MTHDLYGDVVVKRSFRQFVPFLLLRIGVRRVVCRQPAPDEQYAQRRCWLWTDEDDEGDDLRGARQLARSFAPHTCIR